MSTTPTAFGVYRVDRLLGHGMQGETYLASDPAGRQVAVKTIHAMPGRKARSALDTEVVALQSVHPAFAPTFITYDACVDRPYYVMEYVEGRTVDDIIAKEGQLSAVEAERLAVRLTAILAALHSVGTAHGDFRGQNLIVGKDGGIYVLDFGRAVLRSESRKLFRQRRRSDLRQLGELIVLARNGRAPFGEDSSLAIERYDEGRADVGALTGRTRSVALGLLQKRPCWRGRMSAKRAHRILVRGRRARRRVWSGMFVVLLALSTAEAAMSAIRDSA
ncbi:protein kinase [Actinomadura sp. 1N219]|uniref:protein kinase domain-containing protein n=1 Tax=Actinomadura sp. 1N219 TaxID=3375152 RepID=UPI00378E9F23